ncbi:YheC/YheD family endospore coat-associated protein [Metabacillus idriensis]|uniref:YheC/YheD family endospore coat-associated protein n=1 Tax=Metabacillus idriensis TaxID=324768 RepID=UPI00174894AA|nr:YheC/YheD family protein [Metabacillus idriensis]
MSLPRCWPIVGILTGEGGKGKIFHGDGTYFKNLQRKMKAAGGFCYVFTLNGVKEKYIEGFAFSRKKQQWAKMAFPYPNVIYNRIASRDAESSECFLLFKKEMISAQIPFFNSFFFNKWDVHQILSKSLLSYLPPAEKVHSAEDIHSFLSACSGAYLKPLQSSQGQGIYRIRSEEHHYEVTSIDGSSELCDKTFFAEKKYPFYEGYLIQEEIASDTFQNKKYDLRVLTLLGKDDYHICGIGVRSAANRQTLTTHVPNGGSILPFESVSDRVSMEELEMIVRTAGRELASHYGQIGEFSMDIGVTETGPVIYEVNSKPMPFDEPHIQTHRINKLADLFMFLSAGTSSLRSRFPLR